MFALWVVNSQRGQYSLVLRRIWFLICLTLLIQACAVSLKKEGEENLTLVTGGLDCPTRWLADVSPRFARVSVGGRLTLEPSSSLQLWFLSASYFTLSRAPFVLNAQS